MGKKQKQRTTGTSGKCVLPHTPAVSEDRRRFWQVILIICALALISRILMIADFRLLSRVACRFYRSIMGRPGEIRGFLSQVTMLESPLQF